MTQEHSITPPAELLAQWEDEILKHYQNVDVQLLNAYQAGADAELEACCEWLLEHGYDLATQELHHARRPKPPSRKRRALDALAQIENKCLPAELADEIRRALEALPDD